MIESGFAYKYSRTLSCYRCGRILYCDDLYGRDGYGDVLCQQCIDETNYKETKEDFENDERGI